MTVIPSQQRFKAKEISLIDVDKVNNLIVKFILFLEVNKHLYQGKDNYLSEQIEEILESYVKADYAVGELHIRLKGFDILMDGVSGKNTKD